MINLRIASIVCVLTGMLAAGCGDDDDGGGGGGGSLAANCQKTCALRAPLNCSADVPDCVAYCQSAVTEYPNCKAQWEAAVACTATKSTTDFECDPEDGSIPKDGVCSSESTAAVLCIFAGG